MNDFWAMVILMIIFSYLIMSNTMLTFKNGLYNHINKTYMALLMGSLMGIIHYIIIVWHGYYGRIELVGLAVWIIISIILIIIIRRQFLVNDDEFIKGMIEHHDMAVQMSDKIMERTKNKELYQFAENISRTQQNEINWMKKLLQRY